jgi:hypothetical protein
MIKEVHLINSASIMPFLMLQVLWTSISHGILKHECVVRPLGRRREATLEEAIVKK